MPLQVRTEFFLMVTHCNSKLTDKASATLIAQTLVPSLELAAKEFNFSIRCQQHDRAHPILSFDLADSDQFLKAVVPEYVSTFHDYL